MLGKTCAAKAPLVFACQVDLIDGILYSSVLLIQSLCRGTETMESCAEWLHLTGYSPEVPVLCSDSFIAREKNSFLLGMFQPGSREGWAVVPMLTGAPRLVLMILQSRNRAAI